MKAVKFYNPFKIHILESEGFFYVRKRKLIGWGFLDQKDNYWWYSFTSSYKRWANFKTYEDTIKRIELYKSKPDKGKVYAI